MVKLRLQQKEFEGKVFYYVEIGSESHGKPTYLLWIHKELLNDELIEKKEFVFPVRGARLEQKGEDVLVLKPDEGRNVFYFMKQCGYRGSSKVEVVDCDGCKVYRFWVYRSPRGSLGVSEGVLVETSKDMIKVKWGRTGRLYGAPGRGITVLHLDGREEELPFDTEALLSELE
jgi:hypothetical protein